MSVIKKHKKGIAFVVALLAAVVFILPGSLSTAKADEGSSLIAYGVEKANLEDAEGFVYVDFYSSEDGSGSSIGDYNCKITNSLTPTPTAMNIPAEAKSMIVRVNDVGDSGFEVSVKINGVEQWDSQKEVTSQVFKCKSTDVVNVQALFGTKDKIPNPQKFGIVLHFPDDSTKEIRYDQLVAVVAVDDLTKLDFMIDEFIDYTDSANPVHIPLVNVGTNSGAEDAEGRNPLEIQTIRRTATEWDFNIIYHVEDDPVIVNHQCPGFYPTSIALVTNDNAGVEVDFTEVPDMYQSTVYSNKISITGTTADSPAVTGVYYDSPNVTINAIGETEVAKIELGDGINPDAVTITGNKITFNSGYYASIPLKITLVNGEVGYLQLDRIGIALDFIRTQKREWVFHGSQRGSDITTAEGSDAVNIAATYYYSADKSYEDFDVVANLTFADGHTETKVVQGFGETENASDNRLKAGDYLVWSGASADEAPVTVSVTAVNHGAISTDTFGGALFGSGSGVTVTDLASKIRF